MHHTWKTVPDSDTPKRTVMGGDNEEISPSTLHLSVLFQLCYKHRLVLHYVTCALEDTVKEASEHPWMASRWSLSCLTCLRLGLALEWACIFSRHLTWATRSLTLSKFCSLARNCVSFWEFVGVLCILGFLESRHLCSGCSLLLSPIPRWILSGSWFMFSAFPSLPVCSPLLPEGFSKVSILCIPPPCCLASLTHSC